MAKIYPDIQAAGGQLLAVSPQTMELNQGLRERRALPFPILADADQAVIRQWGLFNDLDPKKRLIPYPATYVIGRNGRIAWAYLGIETRDRPTVG
ncbi:MAG: peroxiredoxin family protein, partial [Phycisphaerae bacterium]|nr:peroxiredoxin family protein [Phycisphaerae bacterium]NIX32246.1 redoxin domain-containing protein [Phycisphaerae bacterium]